MIDPALMQVVTVAVAELVFLPIMVWILKRALGKRLDEFDKKRDDARKERESRAKRQEIWELAVTRGLQTMLRSEIVSEYRKAKARGYASLETKEYLERVHHVYSVDLGANSLGTSMYEAVLSMPTEPPDGHEHEHHHEEEHLDF